MPSERIEPPHVPPIRSGSYKKQPPPNPNDEQSRSSGSSSTVQSPDAISKDREDLAIAKDEDQAVFRIRLAVAMFLLICTISVAWAVYHITRAAEQQEFEDAFYEFSTKIFGSIGSTLSHALAGVDSFVVSSVSYSTATNMTWPFVTIPNSATRLSKALSATNSFLISVVPIVTPENRQAWDEYSMEHGPAWVDENLQVQKNFPGFVGTQLESYTLSPLWDKEGIPSNQTMYFPAWQSYPTASREMPPFNFNYQMEEDTFDILKRGFVHVTNVINDPNVGKLDTDYLHDYVDATFDVQEPASEALFPIFEAAAYDVNIIDKVGTEATKMVGFVHVEFFWGNEILNMLPMGVDGILLVISTSCNSVFTYEVNGPDVEFIGYGDHHNPKYDNMVLESSFLELPTYSAGRNVYTGLYLSDEKCPYTFRAYPSETFEDDYVSADPWIYTVVAISIFLFTSGVFWAYDSLVERRQRKVLSTAVKSSAIVSSLFPSNVRDRLYETEITSLHPNLSSQKNRLKSFMADSTVPRSEKRPSDEQNQVSFSRPIADLFPEVTVMFADIAGFTAWSSTREPSQVFILLETLYGKFDALASKRGIFKVETIGDCYVAVAGLPDPCKDHAVVVTKFAHDCCTQLHAITTKLSVALGPDTEELRMRFGLNSGPVTAGVLRGQKSRFQLFGDTVNIAARMESTGETSRIQASPSTADELIKQRKGHWLIPRKDAVEIKGKGLMTTYWISMTDISGPHANGTKGEAALLEDSRLPNADFMGRNHKMEEKILRLVNWNTDVLGRLLRAVVAQRAIASRQDFSDHIDTHMVLPEGLPINEVKEIIELPEFDPTKAAVDPDSIVLDPVVMSQLHNYVAAIAATYHGSANPFHNFEHASHVCMSVAKLMSRIVAVDEFYEQDMKGSSVEYFKYQQTFGIASDPLTLFASTFAALIHDADHPGVPNSQVAKEETIHAKKYGNRSVAEQRSVDVAWELLMEDRFIDLRNAICPSPTELQRFRQLIVNIVMATDIMDKDLKRLRNERWDKAFDSSMLDANDDEVSSRMSVNRKATIVIEHLIQASDVAHTMQHWHIFRKWNERLFAEMFQAYKCGRAEKNPAEFWYQGELGFLDNYVIPLAKKLSDCGVFGVSSDEYLNYAMKNREEWELKGERVVAEMIELVTRQCATPDRKESTLM